MNQAATRGTSTPADAVRGFRWQAWRTILAGLASLAVLAAVIHVMDARSEEWERSADRVSGTVVAVTERSRFPVRRDPSIEVEFTDDGVTRRETIRVHPYPYEIGERVVVLIDPHDADRISVPGESNRHPVTEFLLYGVPGLFGVLAISVGIGLLMHSRTLRRQAARLASLGPPQAWPRRPGDDAHSPAWPPPTRDTDRPE